MRTSIALTPAPLARVPFLFAGRIEEGLRRAAELGYDAVELHLRDPAAPEVAGVVRRAADLGLPVSSLGTGQGALIDRLFITSPDAAVRERALARLESHVDLAGRLGGAVVIIGSMQGRLEEDAAVRASQLDAALGILDRLGRRAVACGAVVAIEPLNRYETNVLNTVADGLALLRRVGSPHVKLLLDTFHMNIEEVSIPDAVRAAAGSIAMVHLADSNRRAAGLGHTDLRAAVAALAEVGYAGHLSAEILPLPSDEEAAAAALRGARAILEGRT